MTTLRTFKRRRQKMAAFLRSLKRSQFDMRIVRNACGTKACVMGWMPTAFPRKMRYGRRITADGGAWPMLGRQVLNPKSAAAFFALPLCEFFYPASGCKSETSKQVAAQLLDAPYSERFVTVAP